MRKYLLAAVFISTAIVWLSSNALAAIPTARMTYPTDGLSICSYSASTTSVSINVIAATQTGTPTSIQYSYRHKGDTAWTVIASTGVPAAAVPWDVYSLTNGEIYELKAAAANTDGTDPAPGFIWVKIDQNPEVSVLTLGGGIANGFNGKTYLKAGTLTVTSVFANVLAQARLMDTSVTPTITLTPPSKSALTGTDNTWLTTGVSSDTCRQSITISDTTGDGEAVLAISGAKDANGFIQSVLSVTVVIDTQKPSVSNIQVDEDGDGLFTDNVGYVRNGQTPRIYVTFNESVFDIAYSSYIPTGKTSIALV
ncbi:MAG: hypothetical protein V1653_01520, partial [bacterium]